jgi:Cys-rich repeat protein
MFAACTKPQQKTQPGCTQNSDCGAGKVCSAGQCVVPVMANCGTQKVCSRNSDCPSSQCNNDTGCCFGVCTSNADCPADQNCVLGVCRELGQSCTSNADCPFRSAPICDPALGACVECVSGSGADAGPQNNQCPAGEYCSNDACIAPAQGTCTTDVQCTIPLLPHCDTGIPGGQCVACLKTSDCPAGDTCTDFVCVEPTPPGGCNSDADCQNNTSGFYCASNGKCVACLVNSNCPSGAVCNANDTCSSGTPCVSDANCPANQPHCRPSDHFCAECATSSQCPANWPLCLNGFCEPSHGGCLSSANCTPPKSVCDTTTRTCTGCLSDDDCPAFCVNSVCQPCSTDLQCAEDLTLLAEGRVLCENATACVQCISAANCNNGDICNEGKCIANPVNQPCSAAKTCLNGLLCIQDGTANGTCRAPCDIYSQTSCNDGLVCGIVAGSTAGEPNGACQPSVAGSASLGSACSSSKPCDRDGVCIPSSSSASTCEARCNPDAQTTGCESSQKCASIVVLASGNVPTVIGVCVANNTLTDPCSKASDCNSGQVCIAEGDPTDPIALRNECWYPTGAGGPGAGCSHPADCQSNLCLAGMPQNEGFPGFCEGGCSSDAQCPSLRTDSYPGACASFPAPWFDSNGMAISTPVNTCVTQCRSDSECPTGKTCDIVADASGLAWATRCVPTNETNLNSGGSVCYKNSDCFSNDCLPLSKAAIGTDGTVTNGGICAGVCNPANGTNSNSDCASGATCPTGGVQLTVSGSHAAPAPICWTRTCTTNQQCGPAGTCTGFPAADNPNDITLNCIPTQGPKEGGANCGQDSDCQSGWCVPWTSTVNECFGACDVTRNQNNAQGMSSNPACATGSTCYKGTWTSTTPNSTVSYCGPVQ